jgi:hypothetical protein
VRIYTGDAFDIVGERKRTDYKLSNRNDEVEEAFEIKVRNRKKEPVEVRVTEPQDSRHVPRGEWTAAIRKDQSIEAVLETETFDAGVGGGLDDRANDGVEAGRVAAARENTDTAYVGVHERNPEI